MKALSRNSSRLAISVGLGAAAMFWVLDLFAECLYFQPNCTCLDLLLHPEPSRLWVRLLASAVVLLLIIQNVILLRHREEAEAKDSHSRFMLEELTIELSQKNKTLHQEITRRRTVEKALQDLAITDPLTGIYNRRKFDELLNLQIRQETRYPRGLALLMIDIDHFKQVNDQLGHAIGDEVLKELGRLISDVKRDADDFFRIGGEEFCLITFCFNGSSLETTAEKLRTTIENHDFPKAGHVTISIGATQFRPDDDQSTLFKRADDALYEAKQTGRNKVVIV